MFVSDGDPLAYVRGFSALGMDKGYKVFATARSTTFAVDLPQGDDEAAWTLTGKWLQGVTRGDGLADTVVAREREVLAARAETSHSVRLDEARAAGDFLKAGASSRRYDDKAPPEALRALTGAQARAFHQHWYRPDNAVVVIVGDAPKAVLQQRLEHMFGGWTAQGAPVAHAPLPLPPLADGTAARVWTAPGMTATLMVCRAAPAPPQPVDSLPRLRAWGASRAWVRILNHRLSDLTATADPPFTSAAAAVDDDSLDVANACVLATPRDGDWRRALSALQTELRRLDSHGVTEEEARTGLLSARDQYWSVEHAVETGPSSDAASAISERLITGAAMAGEQASATFETAAGTVSHEDLRTAFRRDWSGGGPLIAYLASSAPPEADIVAAWRAGEAAPAPAAHVDVAPVAWPYENFGKPGKVVRRQAFPTLDMVRLSFDNGVVANLKTTNLGAEDDIAVDVQFGAGRHELTADTVERGGFAASWFAEMGLGKLSADQIRRSLAGRQWSVRMTVAADAFDMVGATRGQDVETELQVLAAYVSDPGFRPETERLVQEARRTALAQEAGDPSQLMARALAEAAGRRSVSLTDGDDPKGWSISDLAAILGPPLREAPLEVSLAGAVDEKTLTPLLARTFGALPARKAVDRTRPDAWFARDRQRNTAPITIQVEGVSTTSVGALWPLWVATPDRRREEVAMHVVAPLLAERWREELAASGHEAVGAPEVVPLSPDDGDQGIVTGWITTRQADAAAAKAALAKATAAIAAGDFDAAALERARAPLVAASDRRMATNRWWAWTLGLSRGDPARINGFVADRDVFASITADEVKAAAAKWLSHPILLEADPKPPAAGAAR